MAETAQTTAREPARLPIYEALDLTKGGGQAQIVLQDQFYTLRITRGGKLLLTK